MTDPYLNITAMDKDESKRIIVHEVLLENVSTDVIESKCNIANETLLHNNYTDVSEYTISELKG